MFCCCQCTYQVPHLHIPSKATNTAYSVTIASKLRTTKFNLFLIFFSQLSRFIKVKKKVNLNPSKHTNNALYLQPLHQVPPHPRRIPQSWHNNLHVQQATVYSRQILTVILQEAAHWRKIWTCFLQRYQQSNCTNSRCCRKERPPRTGLNLEICTCTIYLKKLFLIF